ncbi:MAG: cupredoxin domain-containing protein [Solirubrobacterales bacterium]
MRKLTIPALVAIAGLTALFALSGIATAEPKTTITLGDNFFSPSTKTVQKGTKVRFKWTGNRRHNVTKASGPGRGFSSATTKSDGVNFAKTFTKSGTYRMFCEVHPTEMKLKIVVP